MAVVAAINIKGQVVALHAKESSICTEDFIVFLNQMRRHRKNRKTYVFLDNLSFHHSRVVLERARKNKQEFIFNAAYSSVYNPIERLWAIVKRQFARDLITEANYNDKEQIKALVVKSILQASESTLTKHVFACLRLMKIKIES